jgi:hypothetical protein
MRQEDILFEFYHPAFYSHRSPEGATFSPDAFMLALLIAKSYDKEPERLQVGVEVWFEVAFNHLCKN